MLRKGKSIAETREMFAWDIPEHYNIGVDISDRPAQTKGDVTAILEVAENGDVRTFSFDQLSRRSNQLANALGGLCATPDRVAVLLPQSIETAVCYAAITKTGCIALPLFVLFGPDALLHRLRDSEAKILITNAEGVLKIDAIRDQLPALRHVICVDGGTEASDFSTICDRQPETFTTAQTRAEDPALLIYTSGTTGPPKGALHAHRVLLGHLPGVEMSHNFFPQPGDRIWTPADWAWIGGLLDVLMPGLHHGVTVVACRFRKFTAAAAFDLIAEHGVQNAFLPPTALKLMRLDPKAHQRGLKLRSVGSGGETLGKELIDWGQRVFGTTINEFYGQTECNMIVSSCAALTPAEPGVMGFAVPGHTVDVVHQDTGQPKAVGVQGAIAVKAPNPVMFLRYWNKPEATLAKFVTVSGEKWLLTGDTGVKAPTGRIAFVGRDDDVISSSGYRIGPAEIEDCLLTHPAVQMAGVVGQPDPIRGSVVAAYVQLVEGRARSDTLAGDIANFVKERLAAHEFPRVVRFVDALPMTTTGKIIRAELRAHAEAQVSLPEGSPEI